MDEKPDDLPAREAARTNWRRGLHRLYVLACVAWALVLLVVFPFREVARSREFAAQSTAMWSTYSSASPQAKAEHEKSQAKLWEQATLPYFYRHEMLANWPWVLAVLVVPPAFLYGLVRGIVAVTAWVLKGFRT